MGRLKIISGGMARDTKIIDEETNVIISNCYKIIWSCDVKNGLAKAKIYFNNVPLEAIGEKEECSS